MTVTSGPKAGLAVNGIKGEDHYIELMKQWRGLDALLQPTVKDKDLATPPGSPTDGACYIVAASPTGAWVGHTGKIARWSSVAAVGWEFYIPLEGWTVGVDDENCDYRYDGASWVVSTAEITATLATKQNRIHTPPAIASSGGTITIDCSLTEVHRTITLHENVTSWSFTNRPSAGSFIKIFLRVQQDAATARTVVSPASASSTAGGTWIQSPTLASVEMLEMHVGNTTVELFPSGVYQ